MKKRVLCLYRVSTLKQVDKNKDDIPMQKQACHECIAAHPDWVLYREISEKGVSGFKVSAEKRDAIQEIQQEALEKKFDVLLVFMFDRLGRRDDETPFVVEWFVKQGNAAMQLEQNAASTLWKAILQDGTLVDPGTDGSLKWDYVNEVPAGNTSTSLPYMLNTVISHPADNNDAAGSMSFANLTAAAGVSVPERLIALALMPEPGAGNTYGSDSVYMRNRGERLVDRGGNWYSTSNAGVFSAIGSYPRSSTGTSIGFRPAFIPDI